MRRCLFIALLVMVSAGCKKETVEEPTYCFSCVIERTPDNEDGRAAETKRSTQVLCGMTEEGMKQVEQSGTYTRKENGLDGLINVRYSTKCRRN